VLGEAICSGLPVLSSKIAGIIGTLGPDYPGYFRAGDTLGLARLMRRFETDAAFRRELLRRCRALRPLFRPSLEKASWRALLAEPGLSPRPGTPAGRSRSAGSRRSPRSRGRGSG
jgi:hypothetical protein